MVDKEKIKENIESNPLFYVKNVLLETTNICNYSSIHRMCPINRFKEKIILPLDIIERIIKELKEYNFSGDFYPFCYSEPLIDPRMFKIFELMKENLPLSRICLYTNGLTLNETMIEELVKFGVHRVNISIYSEKEGIYFRPITVKYRDDKRIIIRAYKRYPMAEKMNDKLDWLENKPLNLSKPCRAPYEYLTINSYGEVVICCHDWKRIHVLGNLNKSSLKEILTNKETIEMYTDLLEGKRSKYLLCSHCYKRR